MQRLPPLHWLRAFEAAARHMSFTAAGREMALTQSAISQRIRLLEHHLGQPLFVRLPRGLQLTEVGRAYLPTVRNAFERIAAGTEEVFGPRRQKRVTLRATPAFAALWLAPRLGRFRARHPAINLCLISAVWPGDFGSGGADLEVRYGHGAWDGVSSERLTREHLFPVCSAQLARRIGSPADLAGETLIHTVGFDAGWSKWLASAQVPDMAERTRPLLCDTAIVALELAMRGEGVALARSAFVVDMLASRRLVRPLEHQIETVDAFYLVNAMPGTLSPPAAAFRQWLSAEARRLSGDDSH